MDEKMRRLGKIILGIFFLVFSSWQILCAGPHYQEMFLQANELYKSGKFEQAYDLYQKIPNKSVSIHYNLGNCAYKLGRLGYSLVHWKRAEKDWGFFNREELYDNIQLVTKKLDKSKQDVSGPSAAIKAFKRKVVSFIRVTPILFLQFLFLLFWIFLFLYIKYLYKNRQKTIIWLMFFVVAFFGSLLVIKHSMSLRRYGIVVSEKAQLLSGPGQTYHVLSFLYEGNEGLIKKQSDGFYKIKIHEQIGWVDRKAFEEV